MGGARTAAGEALLARGRNGAGDWIYSFGVDGAPADKRTDLYTQAFVILGLAEAGRVLAREDFVAAATRPGAAADGVAASEPAAIGRASSRPTPAGRTRTCTSWKPSSALHAATGAAEDLAAATAVAELFMQTLLTSGDRIAEEFDATWRSIEGGGAAPGHQFEWAWLLEQLRLAGGQTDRPRRRRSQASASGSASTRRASRSTL